MEKGTNRDAVPPYSTFAASKYDSRRPRARARDGGGGRAVPVAARGALAADGAETTGRVQPGV